MNENSIKIEGFTLEGFQVSLTLDLSATAATVGQLLAKVKIAKSAGLFATDPSQTVEKQIISTVVRRNAADGTPLVDFYPTWAFNNTYGVRKFAHLYLNTPSDVATFENQTGLKLAELPLYESEVALKRVFDKPTRYEVAVKRPFEMMRMADGEYETGMPRYRYEYFATVSASPTAPMPMAEEQTPSPDVTPSPDEQPKRPATPFVTVSSPKAEALAPIYVEGVTDPVPLAKNGKLDYAAFWAVAKKANLTNTQVLHFLGVGGVGDIAPVEAWIKLHKLVASQGKPSQSPLVQ